MQTRKSRNIGRKATDFVKKTAFTGILAAGLMLGCSRTEPATPQLVPVVVDIQENVSENPTIDNDTEIYEGRRYSFNRSKEAPFAFRVAELGEESATLEFELGTVMPSVNIISQSFRFSGVKVQRDKVNDVIRRMWNESSNPLSKRDLMVVDGGNAPAGPEKMLDNGMVSIDQTNTEPLRRAIEALAFLVDGTKARTIRVLESDDNSYLVETASNQTKMQFRLQKKMGLNVEFVVEKAGYFSMDFVIKRLATDSEGRLSVEYGPDCDGRVKMEIFMSESASGRVRDMVEGCR